MCSDACFKIEWIVSLQRLSQTPPTAAAGDDVFEQPVFRDRVVIFFRSSGTISHREPQSCFPMKRRTGMARILVIAPHADDEVLGVGGTMARRSLEGDDVIVAVFTGHGDEPHPLWGRKGWDVVRSVKLQMHTPFLESAGQSIANCRQCLFLISQFTWLTKRFQTSSMKSGPMYCTSRFFSTCIWIIAPLSMHALSLGGQAVLPAGPSGKCICMKRYPRRTGIFISMKAVFSLMSM